MMNLTLAPIGFYTMPTQGEKTCVGIGTLLHRASMALNRSAFFTSTFRVYGGLLQGASARRPLCGSSNLFKPAARGLEPVGGSSQPYTEDSHMTTKTASSSNKENSRLKDAITNIDGLSQDALPQIISIAKLALHALEKPYTYQHPNVLADAFGAIWGKAEALENSINYEAEYVGCNFVDEDAKKRSEAWRSARKELIR